MKSRRLSQFFHFGYSTAVLHRARAGDDASSLKASAEEFRKSLVSEGFRVSVRVFDKTIAEAVKSLGAEGAKNISQAEAQELKSQVENCILTVNAEIEDIPAFSVSEKRYEFKKLFEDISKLFKPGTFAKFPEVGRFDFAEAGKCILFERSTAAAFHILRGTEDVLRAYYAKLIGPVPSNATWGTLETAIKSHVPAVDIAITDQLGNIRKRFRNPTQHPVLKYDVEEVQDLLNVCIELCNRLSDHL